MKCDESTHKFGTLSDDAKTISMNGEYSLDQLQAIADMMQRAQQYQSHVEMERQAYDSGETKPQSTEEASVQASERPVLLVPGADGTQGTDT